MDEGRRQTRRSLPRSAPGWTHRPGPRPKVVLFGESLGAWTSQDPFVGRGTEGLVDAGIDYAIWIGTPHFRMEGAGLRDDGPT